MKNITDELKYSLSIMHDQSKYAEAKNGSLIVLSGTLLFGIIGNIDNIKKVFIYENIKFLPIFKEDVYLISISLIIAHLFLSMLISLVSFFPQIKQQNLEIQTTKNILFFSSNTSFESNEVLLEYYTKKYHYLKDYNNDISNQILNLARITKRKYDYFRYSTNCLLLCPLITSIISIFCYFII